jgi:hypothetical protein
LVFGRRNWIGWYLGFAVRKLKDFGSESSGTGLFEGLLLAWGEVISDVGRNW